MHAWMAIGDASLHTWMVIVDASLHTWMVIVDACMGGLMEERGMLFSTRPSSSNVVHSIAVSSSFALLRHEMAKTLAHVSTKGITSLLSYQHGR